MKRIGIGVVFLIIGIFVFGQATISGNVFTGIRADITNGVGNIYANNDANGTPIWSNFRVDYSLDKNAGLTVNLRTKGTDAVSNVSSRFYPFLNRGFVWGKFFDGMVKARVGYLWDSDFESNHNGWDTNDNYEWVAEVTATPFENVEVGFTLPTPYNKMDLVDSLKRITYGVVYSPAGMRFSVMGELGAVDTQRSVNFGFDYSGIDNLLVRVEGDLQQIGIDKVGYYQLYQEVNYNAGSFVPNLQMTEWFYKDGVTPVKVSVVPNVTIPVNGMTVYSQLSYTVTDNDFANAVVQAKGSVQVPLNKKAWWMVGTYVTKNVDITISPFVQLFSSF